MLANVQRFVWSHLGNARRFTEPKPAAGFAHRSVWFSIETIVLVPAYSEQTIR